MTKYLEENPLSLNDKVKIFKAVLQEMKAMHQKGIIHGDLSFNNILYDPKTKKVSIIDFGFADKVKPGKNNIMIPFSIAFDPRKYYAPECMNQVAYKVSDTYSLGRWVSWGLTGNWVTGGLTSKHQNVPDELKSLVNQMIAYQPNDRPNIDNCIHALDNYLLRQQSKPYVPVARQPNPKPQAKPQPIIHNPNMAGNKVRLSSYLQNPQLTVTEQRQLFVKVLETLKQQLQDQDMIYGNLTLDNITYDRSSGKMEILPSAIQGRAGYDHAITVSPQHLPSLQQSSIPLPDEYRLKERDTSKPTPKATYRTDLYFLAHSVDQILQSKRHSDPQMQEVLSRMMRPNANDRPSTNKCIGEMKDLLKSELKVKRHR